MIFYQEPTHYEKTIISDLQGAWEVLRNEVIKEHASKDCSQLLFHINEAMSWESVRNLNHMKNTFVLVQSIAQQINVSDEIMELIEDVRIIGAGVNAMPDSFENSQQYHRIYEKMKQLDRMSCCTKFNQC